MTWIDLLHSSKYNNFMNEDDIYPIVEMMSVFYNRLQAEHDNVNVAPSTIEYGLILSRKHLSTILIKENNLGYVWVDDRTLHLPSVLLITEMIAFILFSASLDTGVLDAFVKRYDLGVRVKENKTSPFNRGDTIGQVIKRCRKMFDLAETRLGFGLNSSIKRSGTGIALANIVLYLVSIMEGTMVNGLIYWMCTAVMKRGCVNKDGNSLFDLLHNGEIVDYLASMDGEDYVKEWNTFFPNNKFADNLNAVVEAMVNDPVIKKTVGVKFS